MTNAEQDKTIPDIPKVYEPHEVEARWYPFWEKNGYFKPKAGDKGTFSIVMPPPNVTGALHMGHALDNTLQDILIRWKRMSGFETLWIPGTDHAGIATQNVVEKKLAELGIDRQTVGREAFVDKVWEWKKEYGNRITNQLRKLGASPDWDHERFTMDEGLSSAVQEHFITLYNQGFIYRGDYIINWCPRCHTALSDIEVEYEEAVGHLWMIKYPLRKNPTKGIIVATTRPETMFGDTAVAVNPNDARYKEMIGQKFLLPIANREITVITDEHVDMSFGTGAVKVTPAHDPNDYTMGKKHNLEFITVMDESAKMNDNAPIIYQGMDRYACREELLKDLELQGFLEDTEEHRHSVGHCYRCHTVVEPYLSTQWFVKMRELSGRAVQAVKDGSTEFIPKRYEKSYFDWMENIRDWCISRQIWWGHRIPVYYCEDCGEMYAAIIKPDKCTKCSSTDIIQDPDVLDTWFSSALWPFSTLGWPDRESPDLKKFYPTSVLVTGYDIITFWVSRMLTMGLKQMDLVPFRKVYIHGLIRDEKGRKMSKSIGNTVNPLDLIEKYGTDSLRFTMANLTTQGGQDIKLSMDRLEGSRNFMNKLWNMSRYVLMSKDKLRRERNFIPRNLADQWILSRINRTISKVTELLEDFQFARAAEYLYEFVWNELCDWYIEMSKLNKEHAAPVLLHVLDTTLRLLHPFIPFITEEIWQKLHEIPLGNNGPITSISIAAWPIADQEFINDQVEQDVKILTQIITAIRLIRSEMNIPPSKQIQLICIIPDEHRQQVVRNGLSYLLSLSNALDAQIHAVLTVKPHHCCTTVASGIEIIIPLAGIIDIQEEIRRLEKENEKLEKGLFHIQKKLSNEGFVSQAPPDVIKGEEVKEKMYAEKKKIIARQLETLRQ